MNFVDAIEGTGCAILKRLHQGYLDGSQDDSEFVRNVKAVLEGVGAFISVQAELMIPPEVVNHALYHPPKQLWLEGVPDSAPSCETTETPQPPAESEATDYRHYYFDYLYQHGTYPC